VMLTLFPGFLSGLMFGNMKNIIELHCPIINRINPAAVLSDAFYCLGIYNDMERFTRCILILAVMSILLLFSAFLGVRRDSYDSI
jgi:ABC-2 type transport system permease protein